MNYQPTPGSSLMAPVKPLQPLAALDDRAADASRDFAAAGSYSLYALERMLRDCTEQPEWRLRAKLCAGYYDGKQLDEVKRYLLQQEDVEERIVNLIRPIVNSVLGQEAKSRTDIRVEADDDNYADVAEVISGRLKEFERETYAHQSVSNGYASMVKKGLGWLHVCRNSDPLAYPYRFEDVPIDEIWWDWRGQKGTRLDDKCRWLARMRMVDLDEVVASMPKHRAVLEMTAAGWEDPRMDSSHMLGEPDDMQLTSAYENERRFNTMYRKWDWMDSARKMVKLIEIWYRVPAVAVCLQLSPTKRVVYNPKDPRHVEAVSRGLVKIIKGVTSQVRRALYAGPHRLLDEATERKAFPYVPMFAYRDDEDGSPYGLVDGMIAPQDDYNDRRHRIQWMLKSRQLYMDSDALDTKFNSIKDVADNINRPDLVAILNAHRKNGQHGLRVESTLQVQKEQFTLLEQDELMIQKAAGRYGSNMGEAQVQSGVANQLLVEQGEQAMGEMNDNYAYARRTAFELAVDLICEDHREENIKTFVGQGSSRRAIVLNAWDPQTGAGVNRVEEASIVTAMAETPNTPAYRQQTQQQLKEIITALGNNPQALSLLAPVYIESTSLPNRQQVADDLRDATGIPKPQDRKAREEAKVAQQQELANQAQIAKKMQLAELDDKDATADLKRAQAAKVSAESEMLRRKLVAGGAEAEVDSTVATTEGARAAVNDEDAAIEAAAQDALTAA
ncbi:MAG: hypothetical protein JWQ03_2223 [Variovorax sp.]|nr:hypothetical protein [Variovorax sp.]